MSANNSIRGAVQLEPKKTAREVARSEPICEAVKEPEWFDAFDAWDLLNSMNRKVRAAPPVKLLIDH